MYVCKTYEFYDWSLLIARYFPEFTKRDWKTKNHTGNSSFHCLWKWRKNGNLCPKMSHSLCVLWIFIWLYFLLHYFFPVCMV